MQMFDAYNLAQAARDVSSLAPDAVCETMVSAGEGELKIRIPFIYLYRILPVARRLN